jgi:hypothetical protein
MCSKMDTYIFSCCIVLEDMQIGRAKNVKEI